MYFLNGWFLTSFGRLPLRAAFFRPPTHFDDLELTGTKKSFPNKSNADYSNGEEAPPSLDKKIAFAEWSNFHQLVGTFTPAPAAILRLRKLTPSRQHSTLRPRSFPFRVTSWSALTYDDHRAKIDIRRRSEVVAHIAHFDANLPSRVTWRRNVGILCEEVVTPLAPGCRRGRTRGYRVENADIVSHRRISCRKPGSLRRQTKKVE